MWLLAQQTSTPPLPAEILTPSRVELGQRSDGTSYTRVVEVPIDSGNNISWKNVLDGISSGSWAVLLTLGLLFYFIRGSAYKYLEAHLSLMAAMKDTLKENKEDLDSINNAIPKQTELLLSIKVKTDDTNRSVRKIHENLPVFQSRYDNLQEAVQELKDTLLKPQDYKKGTKRIAAWIEEEEEV